MKKNFKKSKFVILPALATLVLTGVASVTGTVAWFTANRTVSVDTGDFVAYDESRGLEITAKAITGVTIGDDNTTVNPTGVLTDGSFDFTNVWTDVPNTDTEGAQPTSFVKAPSSLKSGTVTANNKEVFYAVQWSYTIGLTNKEGTLAKSIDILFDQSSYFTTTTTEDNNTAKGFRIAMVNGENKFVFSNGTENKHIGSKDGAEDGEEKKWDTKDYLTSVKSYSKLADGVDHTTNNEYLGTITNSTGTITITCTAWYEGTDSSVISNNVMSTVGATLKFYSRNAAK